MPVNIPSFPHLSKWRPFHVTSHLSEIPTIFPSSPYLLHSMHQLPLKILRNASENCLPLWNHRIQSYHHLLWIACNQAPHHSCSQRLVHWQVIFALINHIPYVSLLGFSPSQASHCIEIAIQSPYYDLQGPAYLSRFLCPFPHRPQRMVVAAFQTALSLLSNSKGWGPGTLLCPGHLLRGLSELPGSPSYHFLFCNLHRNVSSFIMHFFLFAYFKDSSQRLPAHLRGLTAPWEQSPCFVISTLLGSQSSSPPPLSPGSLPNALIIGRQSPFHTCCHLQFI